MNMIMNAGQFMIMNTMPKKINQKRQTERKKQIFSVSTVLGEKISDVDQSWRASAKFSGGRLPPTLDRKRTTNRRRHIWWVECFALC